MNLQKYSYLLSKKCGSLSLDHQAMQPETFIHLLEDQAQVKNYLKFHIDLDTNIRFERQMRKKDKVRHKSGTEELIDRREQIRQMKVPRPVRDRECVLKTENMDPG